AAVARPRNAENRSAAWAAETSQEKDVPPPPASAPEQRDCSGRTSKAARRPTHPPPRPAVRAAPAYARTAAPPDVAARRLPSIPPGPKGDGTACNDCCKRLAEGSGVTHRADG